MPDLSNIDVWWTETEPYSVSRGQIELNRIDTIFIPFGIEAPHTPSTVSNWTPNSPNLNANNPITVDITDPDGFGIILLTMIFNGQETLIYNGSFLSGFTGTATPIADGYTLSVTKNGGWPIGTITFKVYVSDDKGATVTATNSWVVGADLTPPALYRIQVVDSQTLYVIFSEPVVMAEATNPANYSITGGLSVLDVVQLDDRTVKMTTSPQTPGFNYILTASNIHDLNGNLI